MLLPVLPMLPLLLAVLGMAVGNQHFNQSARCANQGQVYHPGQDACFPPLTRGPCTKDEMIALSPVTGLGVCMRDACPKSHEQKLTPSLDPMAPGKAKLVYIEGQCVKAYAFEKCQGYGEMLRWTVEGKGECWCEDGWGRLAGSSKCSQQSTQASCPEGQIVKEAARRCTKLDIHEALRGIRNERYLQKKVATLKQIHCGQPEGEDCCKILEGGPQVDLQLDDILGAVEFQHQKYECGPNTSPSGNICTDDSRPWPTFSTSKCFLLSDDALSRGGDCSLQLEGEKISCLTEDDLISLRFATGRKRKCPRAKVWSRLRRRCVRIFK